MWLKLPTAITGDGAAAFRSEGVVCPDVDGCRETA